MQEALEERLRDQGIADTTLHAIGLTIRPSTSSMVAVAATVQATPSTPPRPLPRLSVNLLTGQDGADARPRAPGAADLEVRGLLGEGGMGRVLLARQHSLDRDVAIKTARAGAPEDAGYAILDEGTIAGSLEHPSIVPVHAIGTDADGRPLMVMKRIEGVSWHVLARDPAHAGWEGWEGDASDRLLGHLQILSLVASALHFAHSRGIVHRDVKPENVLIGRFGDVYVADWGVATRSDARDGRLAGTPGYMAPEMVEGGAIDARTDVYLLGATLHELLTGVMRHSAPNAIAALLAARESDAFTYGPDVPAELAELANRACSRDPAQRLPSAQAFREAIARFLRHRDSIGLAARATERLERLPPLLAEATPTADTLREIDRLVAEARFGLEEALRQWSGNAAARSGLDRLEVILESRHARAASLEREARERDPRVEARGRAIAITLLAAFSAAMGVLSATVSDLHQPTPIELVIWPMTIVVGIGIGTFVLRKSVLATTFNRQVISTVWVGLALLMLGRSTGLLVHVDVATHFMRDGFVLAAAFGVGAAAYLRWMAVPAVIFVASGVLVPMFPADALHIFVTATTLAIGVSAIFAWRAVPRS